MANTSRYIIIDEDTTVGYNYINGSFYVTNKGYTTYRKTVADIVKVLNSIGVDTTTSEVNPTTIKALKDNIENLRSVSYTLQDNGAYIHTIQFNDFSKYPLTIDCEKAKIYVMNSTVIYDLTLNESPQNIRIPRIRAFYRDTLGLTLTDTELSYYYSLLVSYYYPTCYNQVSINQNNNELYYNNKFLLSNYNNTSKAVYNCTYNPNNNGANTPVGYIESTDSLTNTIVTTEPIETLQEGDTIIIKGTDTTINENVYSADGTYTIQAMEGTTIVTEETLPLSYSFPYKECYVVYSPYTIKTMSSFNSVITLTQKPTNLSVGDIILVSGATVSNTYDTISCNGTYTVKRIGALLPNGTEDPNAIVVEEEIPTDFNGTGATLIKEIFISNISSISNNTLTLTDTTELNLTGANIYIHTIENEETTMTPYTVQSYTPTTITVSTLIPDYTPNYPELLIPKPTGEVETLIEVTSVKEEYQDIFPTGEFMTDSFEQCVNYIGLLEGLTQPTEEIKNNMYQPLPKETEAPTNIKNYTIATEGTINPPIPTMKFKGLYSNVYSEN